MATYTTVSVRSGYAPIGDEAGEESITRVVFPLVTALVAGDVIDMAILPADQLPTGFVADFDALDSNGTPTMILNLGLITGIPGDTQSVRSVGQQFLANDVVARAGGISRLSRVQGARITGAPVDRSIGFYVGTAAATAVTGSLAGLANRGAWRPGWNYAVNDYITLDNGVILFASTGGTSTVFAAPDTNVNPIRTEPDWQIGKGLTTPDGTVVWTCQTPVIGLTVYHRPSVRNL
jgi:hypothetical protein